MPCLSLSAKHCGILRMQHALYMVFGRSLYLLVCVHIQCNQRWVPALRQEPRTTNVDLANVPSEVHSRSSTLSSLPPRQQPMHRAEHDASTYSASYETLRKLIETFELCVGGDPAKQPDISGSDKMIYPQTRPSLVISITTKL